ncbi:AzlC family ABC transporter permease [Thalassospira sp.]|uniref:AzlC family ABC transporter permease n=1 Tax=Thalassospira sp. TaxID=1912094 RepID=UPI000C4CE68F|nr:AzlC family ABC transporter permease [Thalassospira sp.]MBC05133.1 branched-chain amino acid permease [Thalassospira sp.]|tara:strand:+ start:20333 stop:21178 length:846 start_codon:yes stop_codon:yes gene_type:complete
MSRPGQTENQTENAPEKSPQTGHFDADTIRRGAIACLPLLPSTIIFGAVLGVLSAQRGLSLSELLFMSLAVFAGSAQFVSVDLWRETIPSATIIIATAVINMRYVLIGASLRPVFRGRPLWVKVSGMHMVADENWAVTMTQKDLANPGFLLGGGIFLGVVWATGNTVGYLLGGGIPDPEVYALDFAFTAVFAALTIGMWKGRVDLLPWIAAAIGSIIGHFVLPGTWSILAGAGAGVLVAALTWREDMDADSLEAECAVEGREAYGAPEGITDATPVTETGK